MIRFLGWKDLNACTFWGLCLSYTRKRLSIEEKEGSKCLFVCIWDYVNSFTQWCNHTLHFVVETVIPNDLSCWKMSNHLCMQLVLLLPQTMNFLKWLHAKLHQYCSALPLWRKFPFERKFLQCEGNLKEINFEGNVKEILEEQRKFEGKSKISPKLIICNIFWK